MRVLWHPCSGSSSAEMNTALLSHSASLTKKGGKVLHVLQCLSSMKETESTRSRLGLLQSIRLHTEPWPVVSGLYLSADPVVHCQTGLLCGDCYKKNAFD